MNVMWSGVKLSWSFLLLERLLRGNTSGTLLRLLSKTTNRIPGASWGGEQAGVRPGQEEMGQRCMLREVAQRCYHCHAPVDRTQYAIMFGR